MVEVPFRPRGKNIAKEIVDLGGEGIKKCYQCGTCTAICPHSQYTRVSFRKIVKYIQLGLESKVLQMPIMWFCAECRDCAPECPRNADLPSIMKALREYSIARWSVSYGFAKALMQSPWVMLSIISILIVSISFIGIREGIMSTNVAETGFVGFIPEYYYHSSVIAMMIFFLGSISWSIYRLISDIKAGRTVQSTSVTETSSLALFKDLLIQRWLQRCKKERTRWIAHMMVSWGFLMAFLASTLRLLLGLKVPPPLLHPVKILGNIGGILLIVGGTILIIRRALRKDIRTLYYDYSFLVLLYITSWLGLITQFARLANVYLIAYGLYVVHISTAIALLLFAPYTKFVHLLYMPLLIWIGRTKGWVK